MNNSKKLVNIEDLEEKIKKIYIEEYNENFENILLKKEADFLLNISENVKITLEEKYSKEIYKITNFIDKLKSIEKNLYYNMYLKDKEIIINNLKNRNIDYIENGEKFNFLKHCKYQNDIPIHNCNKKNNFLLIPNEEKNLNEKIYILTCTYCLRSYKINFIKLYCNFCQIEYLTKLINSDDNESFLQPATWEKYHCHLIINQQMGCIKCKKGYFYLNIKENKIICKMCNFSAEPNDILWRCIKCGMDFRSDAKVYNPYNYKTISLAIKKGIINKISAVPNEIPCHHNRNNIHHKRDCNGNIYLSDLNGSKIVICSKCNAIVKYEKFIFECGECLMRFRAEINEEDILKEKELEIQNINKEKKYINDFYKNVLKKEYNFDLKNNKNENINNNQYEISTIENTINIDTNSKDYNEFLKRVKSFKDDYNDIIEYKIKFAEEKNLKKEKNEDRKIDDLKTNNNKNNNDFNKEKIVNEINNIYKNEKNMIPLFNLDEYEIISQIGESKKSKIYCVKKIDNNLFYTLKKRYIISKKDLDNYLHLYKIQYSLSNILYITKVYGLYYNENEINILTECGMKNWASEIYTYKKMKKLYSEIDLINIIYQISFALSILEERNLCHFCINPNNITVFNNQLYKISDFEHLTFSFPKIIWRNENKFISPNLNYFYKKKDPNYKVNLLKNDVFSLGLCCIFTMDKNNDINFLYNEFVNIDILTNINRKIKNYIYKVIQIEKDENLYSEKFINLICNMMTISEEERFYFKDILNYISKEYKIESEI